jgi:uncharacterized coiled-coil DUF342 family protein
MPLHASLGLAVPKAVARLDPADTESSEPVDAGGQKPPARAGSRSARPRASVTEGQLETVTVRKEPLGKLYWERRYKGQLFAFTDASGKRVTGGPGTGWKSMSACNVWGLRVVAALGDLDRDERAWRALVDRVHKGTADGQALAQQTAAAAGAIRQRRDKDKEFREAMRGYFQQFHQIQSRASEVASADAEFNEKLSHLAGVVTEGKIEDAKGKVDEVQGEIDQVKADIEQAKAIFSKVLSVGMDIRNFAVAPSVDALVSKLGEGVTALAGVIIEGQYAAKLGVLDAQLAQAKGELKRLKNERFQHAVKEAQAMLLGTIARCRKADNEFRAAVKELRYKRADASSEADEKGPTRFIAKVIAGRAQQRQAIQQLRDGGAAYVKLLDGVAVGVAKLTGAYAHVGDWIDDIAKALPQLARGSAWANGAELTAASNAVMLGNWTAYLPAARGDCEKALKSVGASAMAPYEAALSEIEGALGQDG